MIRALFEAAHRRTGLSTSSAWALKVSGAYGGTLSDREGKTHFTSFTCTLHEFRKAGDSDREVTAEVKYHQNPPLLNAYDNSATYYLLTDQYFEGIRTTYTAQQ